MPKIDIDNYIEQSGMRKARFGGYEPDDVRQARQRQRRRLQKSIKKKGCRVILFTWMISSYNRIKELLRVLQSRAEMWIMSGLRLRCFNPQSVV